VAGTDTNGMASVDDAEQRIGDAGFGGLGVEPMQPFFDTKELRQSLLTTGVELTAPANPKARIDYPDLLRGAQLAGYMVSLCCSEKTAHDLLAVGSEKCGVEDIFARAERDFLIAQATEEMT
jgi:hypothetical protein